MLDDFHESTNVPVSIPDGPGGVVESVLNISENVAITDLNVHVVITHTWIRDLKITIRRESEDDTSGVLLLDLFPADNAINMNDTWFDDQAGVDIYDGAPPFEGLFKPLDTLSVYDGQLSAGNWILRVEDRFAADTGSVVEWGIDINHVNALSGTLTSSGGADPAPDIKVEVLATPFQTVTASNGSWTLSYPLSGSYSILFSSAVFDSLQIDNVVIVEGQTTVIDTSVSSDFLVTTVTSRGEAVQIPDTNTATKTLTVAEHGLIHDIDVTVNIDHTWTTDLSVTISAPNGTSVNLIPQHCPDDRGANFVECRLDDEATTPITAGVAPYTGSFVPEEPLSGLDSLEISGTWSLTVTDECAGDSGTIQDFSVHLVYTPTLDVNESSPVIVENFEFHGAYPNPFNASTTFSFDLTTESNLSLTLFDLLGRAAATVFEGRLNAGNHEIHFNAENLPSGVYLARLSDGDHFQTQKIVLLK